MVDEEQRGVAGDLRRAVRRVVDRHDRRARLEPVVGHRLAPVRRGERRDGDDDVRAGDRLARIGVRDRVGDASGRARRLGERVGPLRMAVEDVDGRAGQDVPEHRQVGTGLDARADERDLSGARPAPARSGGARRR